MPEQSQRHRPIETPSRAHPHLSPPSVPFSTRFTPQVESVEQPWHELGHGFGFGGYGNASTPIQYGAAESGYDRYVRFYGGSPYFVGPTAEAVYGGPVPLTLGR